MVRTALLGGLALLAGAEVAAAQGQPAGPESKFGERIEVREVLLDALVTDRAGNVIIGLNKNDFDVRESGKPVNLSGVTFYSNRRLLEGSVAASAKGIQVDQVPEDRYFILLFDDQRPDVSEAPGALSQQIEAGRRARAWVGNGLLANDWVAVAAWTNKLVIYQDFTHNRDDLANAISEAVQAKDKEANWPSRTAAANGPSLLARLPRGEELSAKTTTRYAAFEQLAAAAAPIVGRKNVLFFSRGFGEVREFGQYRPDPRYDAAMIHALNTANVAVYTLDVVPAGTHHTMSNALQKLATDTGGRYFWEVTNYETVLGQVAQENSGYYLLSYRSERPQGQSGYQAVEVKTTNPEFKVTARRGYNYGP